MVLLGWFLFGVPLFLGIILILAGRYLPKLLREWTAVGTAGMVLGCLLVSFSFTGTKLTLFSEWWPGSGELYLKFDFLGLVPAFWTTASGLIFYLLSLKESTPRTCTRDGLFVIVLTTANLAFLTGNFVLRYAALEFTALGIAAVQLLEMGHQTSQRLYMGLRLGDAGLLVAIILLNTAGGSLEISKALALAIGLPEATLTWVAIGFLLAVWVKMGIWPLLFWQNAASATPFLMSKAWFLATVMPNLGIYLLYRTSPLIAQFETVRNLVSVTAAASAMIAMLLAWGEKNLKGRIWLLFAFQGSITLFAAVHRLDTLVWGSILAASLLRFIFFGKWMLKGHPAYNERLASIAGGVILGAYTFVVIWAIEQQGERMIDSWMVEASLALLVLWFANQWEKALKQARQGRVLLPADGHRWQRWGIPITAMLLFIAIPLLFSPFKANEVFTVPSSFTKLSLISLPIISPSFWGLLISVWVVSKLKWFEKIKRLLAISRQTWLAGVRHIPEGIYNFMEVFLYQEGLNQAEHMVFEFSRFLYEIFERATFEKGLNRLAHMLFEFSRYLYEIFERATFETVLQYMVKGSLAFSTMLRRMHTGRLRVNLMWVAVTMVIVLAIVLAGTGG